MSSIYKIIYLPEAKNDMLKVSRYIANNLKSPQAARNLLKKIDSSIELLKNFPYSYPLFYLKKPLSKEFRILPVKNFAIMYIVDESDKVVEIQAIIYSKRDLEAVIKG